VSAGDKLLSVRCHGSFSEIGENPWCEDFKDWLRWNDLYYQLAKGL
jgi:hypothetical protein